MSFEWKREWGEPKPYVTLHKIVSAEKERQYIDLACYDFTRQNLLVWAHGKHVVVPQLTIQCQINSFTFTNFWITKI